jgi:hypothetical protein
MRHLMFLAADEDIYAAGILFDNVIFPSYCCIYTLWDAKKYFHCHEREQINLP